MITLPTEVAENLIALGIEPIAVRVSCGCLLVRLMRSDDWRWQARCDNHVVQYLGVAPGTLCVAT